MSFRQLRGLVTGLALIAAILVAAALLVLASGDDRDADGDPAPQTASPQAGTAAQETVAAQTPQTAPPAAPQTAGGDGGASGAPAQTPGAVPTLGEAAPAETNPARRAILERIASAPEISDFFDRLRTLAPRDYDAALDNLEREGLREDPDAMLSEAVKTLRQRHGAIAARADDDALQKIFARHLAVLEALQPRNPRECVEFLYGGSSEGFFRFAADNRKLVADLAAAGLDAIVNGEQKNVVRKKPNEDDFSTLERALREAGLTAGEIGALLDGRTPDPPPPDARMCVAGVTYLRTLASLPVDLRMRIYGLAVEMMAKI